jgi:hypothetical protein
MVLVTIRHSATPARFWEGESTWRDGDAECPYVEKADAEAALA